jgi:hypothetical protein
VGQHGSASGSILLGLDGFEVTAAEVIDDEWRLAVQTTATTVGCAACGSQPGCMLAARSRCGTCRSAAARWCWPGASGCGAVWSRPVRSRPGPSRRSRSVLGRC